MTSSGSPRSHTRTAHRNGLPPTIASLQSTCSFGFTADCCKTVLSEDVLRGSRFPQTFLYCELRRYKGYHTDLFDSRHHYRNVQSTPGSSRSYNGTPLRWRAIHKLCSYRVMTCPTTTYRSCTTAISPDRHTLKSLLTGFATTIPPTLPDMPSTPYG